MNENIYNPVHCKKLLQTLNNLRDQNQLCDITINVGGRAFHAHKAVLAASCSYFMAMFTSGFKESTQNEVTIDGNPEVFEMLLNFAYTGKLIKKSYKIAYDVLEMACYMQYTDASKLYCDLIKNDITLLPGAHRMPVEELFKVWMLARTHKHLANFATAAEAYVKHHVEELIRTKVFLEYTNMDFLEEFLNLESGFLNEIDEIQVLQMVVNWLNLDWEDRRINAPQLLQKVRLGLVPTSSLLYRVGAEIFEIPECKELIDRVFQLQSYGKTKTSLAWSYPELFATKSTITAPITSLTRCRHGKKSFHNTEFMYYDVEKHVWSTLQKFAPLPRETANHSIIMVEGELYAIGGIEEKIDSHPWHPDRDQFDFVQKCCQDFFWYDAEKNRWKQLPSMSTPRSSCLTVHLDGFIYAIAGWDGSFSSSKMKDVERYNMTEKEWEVCASLPDSYQNICAVIFRDKLIVYGALTGCFSNQICTTVLLLYDPHKDCWETLLHDQHESCRKLPVLFVYKNTCYRIVYKDSGPIKPSVHELDFRYLEEGVLTVSVGEEVEQDHIPGNEQHSIGAFQILGDIFVNVNGFVCNSGIKAGSMDVDLYVWKSIYLNQILEEEQSNIIYFTFDKKRLEN